MKLSQQLFAVKTIQVLEEELVSENRLRRVLGPVSLTALGVGAIIGAGIFVLTGLAAHDYAGPALMLSFVLAGAWLRVRRPLLCRVRLDDPGGRQRLHLCLRDPRRAAAWIIGWDLILEYGMASSTVAYGWSKYFLHFIELFGLARPALPRLRPVQHARLRGSTCRRCRHRAAASPSYWSSASRRVRRSTRRWSSSSSAVVLFVIGAGVGARGHRPTGVRSCPSASRASRAVPPMCSSPTSASTRLDPRRGGAQPAARRADRHPGLAVALHRALHRGRGGADGHGAVRRDQHRRPVGGGVRALRHVGRRASSSPSARWRASPACCS